ncbi:HAD family phosphatase [Pseudoalteromonas luteoviolacea]|uniref:HAD family hydrolase n=1 Tax=Pseudoalteromonas luteoviolacea TaxID=43657 RepID=UPI001B37075B|nr:HAD family phosphatase [Pseudoalteromonas luteoviolacea]MBQ4809768.1 HAD family phosphatase [Pseudoalteromonas luteoviolacea]
METTIKNVVFDIGNVVVRWSPEDIISMTFGKTCPKDGLIEKVFHSDIWLDLNKGLKTEQETKLRYQKELGLSQQDCERLFHYIKHSLIPVYNTEALIKRVKKAGYRVYALTDNVHEIVDYLKETYQFWPLFEGAIVSADLGVLKPQPAIYDALLTQFSLNANETVFIDDMPHNVAGAKAMGIEAIQFEDAGQCEMALNKLGLEF